MSDRLVCAVDFDGTCVFHRYPEVGKDVPLAAHVLRTMVERYGWKLILLTMRSGAELQDAVKWFQERGIPLYSVNSNPTQRRWTASPKVHRDLYIGDEALGCPLMEVEGERPVVDWSEVASLLFGGGAVL